MKINRTKNAINNIVFGFINKCVSVLLPFIVRTIIIKVLGVQYLGLSSLFTSILQILSLAELGFGTALIFSMYKPIAEDDTDTINALLNLYKKIYRIIGIIVFVIGLGFIPFLGKFIKGSYPEDISLFWLYLIYLTNTVISYLFFAYRNSLLAAHQRNDMQSKIQIICSLFMYGVQIAVLILFKNYYVYCIVLPASTLLNNIITLFVTKKKYPQYFCKGTVSTESKREIKKQVYSLFLHRIGYVVQSSIDNICISAFMGLVLLGRYNNYYYIITAIQAFMTMFKQSMVAGVGNSLIVESKEYNKKYFNKILFLFVWIVGWCSTCLMCLYQPFMNLWVGAENMLPITVVVSLVILFYINETRGAVGLFKDALGMWYEDRFKPATISLVNLGLTIIAAYFGFFEGIILATAVAYLFVGMVWETIVFFKHYMKEKPYKYLLKQLFYLVINLLALCLTYYICSFIIGNGIKQLIMKVIICIFIPNIIFILFNVFNPDFRNLLKSFKRGDKIMGKIRNILKKIYSRIPKSIKHQELSMENRRYNIMLKLKKKYSKFIQKDIVCDTENSDYVFTCWLQGEENAPELVKKCIESMRKHFKDKNLVVITNDNLKDYTNLPDFIIEKWKKGIISNTHFSDILRTNLLINNGGLWLDSTVLCTGNLDKYIDKDTDFFVYKNEHRNCDSLCLSSWLIYSKKNHPLLVNVQNLIFKYWEKKNKLIEYFLFHILFTIVSGELKEEWEKIPFFSNIDPHVLWFYSFYEKFDKNRFKKIKEMSNFHKLSYKFDPKLLKEDSFYEHLLKGDYE